MCVGSKLFMYPSSSSDNTIEHIFTLNSTLAYKIRQLIRNLSAIPDYTCSVASSLQFNSGGLILVGDVEENNKIKNEFLRNVAVGLVLHAFWYLDNE